MMTTALTLDCEFEGVMMSNMAVVKRRNDSCVLFERVKPRLIPSSFIRVICIIGSGFDGKKTV